MKRVLSFFIFIVLSMFITITSPNFSFAEEDEAPFIEQATDAQIKKSQGHFARARSLLIAAINEFDRGTKVANPESLLDVSRFRTTLIDRAEELERILDPQPRTSKEGVKFSPDTRLLGEAVN